MGGNAIYAAACGKSYLDIVKNVILIHGIMSFNLHLYLDKDVSDQEVIKKLEEIKPFVSSVFIHRNSYKEEKDYGVSMDRIIDGVRKVY